MPPFVDVDSCLQTVKLIAAAGEMAPFPFIKGAALCAVVILENIQVCHSKDSFVLSASLMILAESRKQ